MGAAQVIERKGKMKRKQPFWVRLFSPVRLKTQRIYVAGSHPRVRLAAFNVFVGVGSFLVAFLLGSVLMIPGESNAEDVSVLSNDASLSVALTPETMNLAVTPTPDGTLASDELAIQVNTDNTTGYALTLALAGSESSLYDPTSGGEIQSTTAAMRDPNTLAVNTWGWYPDSLANNTGNLFSALPSNSDPYELKKTSTPTSGSGDTTTISFGVKADTTLPAGSYTNAIVISAVTNYVPQPILDVYPTTGWVGDTITLYSNGGFVNVQSVQIGGTNCTSIDVKSADELTCTLPNKAETNTTSGADNGYSIAVTASNTSLDTHNFTIRYFNPSTTTSMQEFTSTTCGSMSVGDIVSLTDDRNGQTYRIKKMQDEKCWMVDNIKYKGEGITISNVDGTEGIILNDTDGRYNTVDGTGTESAENFDNAFYNNPMVASYCYGDSIQSSYTKCGYLYNWYAATAGTGTYGTTENTNISGSICPTNWRLPTARDDSNSSTNADFAVLNASMNIGSLTSGSTSNYPAGWQFTGAWSGVFSGRWGGSFSSQGSRGYYWSSTASSSTDARNLTFYSSNVNPDNSRYGRYSGLAVRCVMDSPGVQIAYDANGGYFDNEPSKTTNMVLYDSEELSTETFNKEAFFYDETITIPGATSLVVDFSCSAGRNSQIYLKDGSGKMIVECTDSPSFSPGGPIIDNSSVSGTYIIPGDTAMILGRSNIRGPSPSVQATITGYSINATAGTEDLTPTRSGYDFVGWYKDAAGTAGNEFTVTSSIETSTVYAKWGQNFLDDVTYMQDLTAAQCSDSGDGVTATLIDQRDNNTYTIAKINGNCWMTQNLRIAGGTTLDSSTSNVASSYTIPTTPLEGGDSSYIAGQVQDSGNTTNGYWYNFCAASAGTNCQDSEEYDTTYDICPKGWRLPTEDEFDALIDVTSYIFAFSPVTGGYYSIASSLDRADDAGYWWSSSTPTAGASFQASLHYDAFRSRFSIGPQSKEEGNYVRCIRSS